MKEQMVNENVHVLLVTIGLQGHLNPMIKFARRLTQKGVRVTLAANEMDRDRLLRTKKALTSDASTISGVAPINLVFFSDGLSPEFEREKNGEVFFGALSSAGSKNLSDLVSEHVSMGTTFSSVVYNPFLPWVADVASNHGIPCGVLWIQAWCVFSIYYHYYMNPHYFIGMEKGPNEIIPLPGMHPIVAKDLPSFILPSDPPFLKELVLDFARSLEKVKWVLGNSYLELEEEVHLFPIGLHTSILSVGPLVSPVMLGQEEEKFNPNNGGVGMSNAECTWMKWLDQQPPNSVVYVCFGSMLVLSEKQVENIAIGLKNSKRPFLWVVKPQEMASIKAAKEGEIFHDFVEETRGRGLIMTWCTQEVVLTHPAIACFVTHCGWNSTIETVCAGVPVIAAPKWSDQPANAMLLVNMLRVGIRLGRVLEDEFSARGLEDCITEVMEGPNSKEMRVRATELKKAARRAVGVGGSSDRDIDRFINDIKK